ncbi:hypothetical protein RJ226_004017 [Enterobacter hormaechei]|nr:hypothetical protein [Enterobacter hormaechei]ELD3190805.1 hypothetical protein [Enterobacter hormaechei]
MLKKIKNMIPFFLLCSSFTCWSEEKVLPKDHTTISKDILQQMATNESNLNLKKYKVTTKDKNHELPEHNCVIGYFFYYTTESKGMYKLHAINDTDSSGKPEKILRMECNNTDKRSYTSRATSKK